MPSFIYFYFILVKYNKLVYNIHVFIVNGKTAFDLILNNLTFRIIYRLL